MKHINLLFFFLIVLSAGCRKTENFYNQLDQLPRINNLGNTAYAVGDTLTLTGKLGAGKAKLKITIGGIEAPVFSIVTIDSTYTEKEVLYNYTFDKVKMLITEAMIGQQQLVVATVNGVGSTLAAILVSKNKPLPARTDTLNYLDPKQAVVALRMPAGTRIIPNYTPGGAIVFMSGDSLITWQEGVIRRGKVMWKDSYGDFTIINAGNLNNYGFATDPAGNNLYISCITKDALLPETKYSATRLMKVSLHDYSVTTLNRTVIPTYSTFINTTDLDPDAVKKEGPINEVFFPVVKNMYINKAGDIYFSGPAFNWNVTNTTAANTVNVNLTAGCINASGLMKYLAKGNTGVLKTYKIFIRKDGRLLQTYDFMPGLTNVFNYDKLLGIDAENGLLYGYTGTGSPSYTISTFYCYNLIQQRQAGEFTYKPVQSFSPTITDGLFNVVEGIYREYGTRVFQWPSPGQSMVIFAEQQQYQQLLGQFGADELRSVKMINFSNRTVSTYAPFIQGASPGTPYRLGIGGDVIGYTASKQPVMVRTNEIDATLNEVLLLVPVK